MRKRLALLFCAIVILTQIPIFTSAQEGTLPASVELQHVHSGDGTAEEGCYIADYHVHTGDSINGGGCYTEPYTETTGRCSACQSGNHANHVGAGSCWYEPDYGYHCNCGHTVTKYNLGCGKDGSSINGYLLNCHLTEGEVIGTYSLTPAEQTGIVNTNQLTASISSLNSLTTVIGYEWSTGEDTEAINAEKNGTYACRLTYSDNGMERTQDLSINVSNIDNLAPAAEITFEAGWCKEDVTVTLSAADAPATEESCCSGLAAESYSWDGGLTWGTETEKIFTESENLALWVRDNAGNIAKKSIEIKIDKLPPIVALSESRASGEVSIIAAAEDVSGGNAAQLSGLAAEAYSWDGGLTWTNHNSLLVGQNGSYSVAVKDNAGNIATASITINSITVSTPAPVLPTPEPEQTLAPTPAPTPERKVIASIVPVPPTETEEPPEETPTPTPKPTPMPKKTVEPEEVEEVVIIEEDTPTFYLLPKIIATTAGAGTATGGITFFIVFWIFRKCYVVDELSGKRIGKAYIWKKKGRYRIKISENICKKSGSKMFLKFQKSFVKANIGKPVNILISGHNFEKDVKEKISITI